MEPITDKAIEPNIDQAADQRPAFQDRLRKLMAAKPATYRETAEAVNLSQMTVRAWMGGETIPTVNQAQLLDKFFGTNLVVEYDDILRRTGSVKTVKPKTNLRPKPQLESQEPLKQMVKGLLSFKKNITDAVGQAQKEVYGEDKPVADDESLNTKRLTLYLLSQVLDCLQLLLKDQGNESRC